MGNTDPMLGTSPTTAVLGVKAGQMPAEVPSPLRHRFENQLNMLLQQMLEMAASCREMLHLSLHALTTQDAQEIQSVLRIDDGVDAMEQEIEAEAIRLLALQQPVLASDLRFVSMVLKAVTDLERIGDHCVNIAKVGRKMAADQVIYQPLVDIERLAHLVAVMLDDTSRALVKRDVTLARSVIGADDEVDILYQEMQRDLRERMQSGEAGIVSRASYLLFVLHYLERIGDHCVGIAERLLYVATGTTRIEPESDV